MNPDASTFVPNPAVPENNNLAIGDNGLTIDTSPSSAYNHEAVIQDAVKFQIEYHFSDTNLSMDNYLLSRMHEDPEYWVPVKTVANLTKIRSLTENEETVLEAIKESDQLILNNDCTKVKRPSFIPPKPKQHKDLRRTVFLYGIPKNLANNEQVTKLCNEFGKVKTIYFDKVIYNNDNDNNNNSAKNSKDFDFNKSTEGENNTNDDKNNNNDNNNNDGNGNGNNNNNINNNDGPDRDVALVLMTKRFGGRLIRQSSVTHNSQVTTPVVAIPGEAKQSQQQQQQQLNIVAPPPPTTTPVSISLVPDGNNNNNMNVNVLNGGVVPPSPSPLTHPVPNPNGNMLDFSHLRSCFVVFESQSQANKLVKSRSRAADGIRAMHQYDFNKARKKVAAAKAKGISPVFSPAHIALALSPNADTDKILSNKVAISPKVGNNGNNNNNRNSYVDGNGLLSPGINNISNINNNRGHYKQTHRNSGDSFMSQGSQISNKNVSLPGSNNDMEWQLKQENFELQKANLTLQQALQQNIETMQKMQLLYNNTNPQQQQQQRKSYNGQQKGRRNNNNNINKQHPMSARHIYNRNNNNNNNRNQRYNNNNNNNNRSSFQKHNKNYQQQQQPSMSRRHTFDNRAQTAKNANQLNAHFGDWRNGNKNNGNSNNNNKNGNDARRFVMPVNGNEQQRLSKQQSNDNKYRANKSNPQSMRNQSTKNKNGNQNGKLFFSLEGNDEPIAPTNTPQSEQGQLLRLTSNGSQNHKQLISPMYSNSYNHNNNGHYFASPQYNQNGAVFLPVASINDASLQHIQQQQQQRQ